MTAPPPDFDKMAKEFMPHTHMLGLEDRCDTCNRIAAALVSAYALGAAHEREAILDIVSAAEPDALYRRETEQALDYVCERIRERGKGET